MMKLKYEFWMSDCHGIVRQRRAPGLIYHPEVWRDGGWYKGSPYVMDAITGMGEDPYSCGEWAHPFTLEQAIQYAAENCMDLFAENPDDPYPPKDQADEL